jgi:N-acetylneuraminic acid mutarotase
VYGEYSEERAIPSVELYNPSTNSWTSAGNLLQTRGGHRAVLFPDGRVLVVGGIEEFSPLASAELYDSTTNNWSPAASLSKPRSDLYPPYVFNSGHDTTLLQDGRVLIVGGCDEEFLPLAAGEIYDSSSNSWVPSGSLVLPRFVCSATLLQDGRVLVAGGHDENLDSVNSVEIYNPASDSWIPTDSLIEGRCGHRAVLLSDGKVLGSWRNCRINL